jgi:hypothetical protein
VEIGVFAADEDEEAPLYVRKHRIRSAELTITVTVPGRPARAGIDPYHLLIDLEADDNLEDVTTES